MTKNLKLLAGVFVTSCLVTSCSAGNDGSETAADPTTVANAVVESATTSAQAESAQFDTGEYFTKHRVPYKEQTTWDGGAIAESNHIADTLILPFEVNEKFTEGTGSGRLTASANLFYFMSPNYIDALDKNELPVRSGYWVSAGDNSDDSLINAVIRFDSPEKAQQAAKVLHTTATTEGASLLHNDSEYFEANPDDATGIEGKVNTYAAVGTTEETEFKKGYTSVQAFTPYNEFLVYNYGQSAEGNEAETKTNISSLLDKQIPLLDAIPTHKTDAGYGKLKDFAKIDEFGLTRLAVLPLPDEKDWASSPFAGFATRGFVVSRTDPKFVMDAANLAGIENFGIMRTAVAQARDSQAANLFKSALLSSSLSEDAKEYDEPQSLPDTSCYQIDLASGTYVECILTFEDKVAIGDGMYRKPIEAPTTTSDAVNMGSQTATPEKKDPTLDEIKKDLSQRMAAQLAIFEDAKVNPDGSKPPAAGGVDPNKAEPSSGSATTSAESSSQ